MPGMIVRLVSKQKFDFSQLAINQTQDVVAAKAVDISSYREGTVLIRLHASTMAASQILRVVAKLEAPTSEDPSTDFIAASETVSSDIINTTAAGTLVALALPANAGAWLRVLVRGIMPASVATFNATLSIDLSLKS